MKKYEVYKCALMRWFCDTCDVEVVFTGWINTEDTAYHRYEHKCPSCEKKTLLVHKYPCMLTPEWLPDDVRKKLKIKLSK